MRAHSYVRRSRRLATRDHRTARVIRTDLAVIGGRASAWVAYSPPSWRQDRGVCSAHHGGVSRLGRQQPWERRSCRAFRSDRRVLDAPRCRLSPPPEHEPHISVLEMPYFKTPFRSPAKTVFEAFLASKRCQSPPAGASRKLSDPEHKLMINRKFLPGPGCDEIFFP